VPVLLLDREIEDLLYGSPADELTPEERDAILTAVSKEATNRSSSVPPVILTTIGIRRKFLELIRHAFPYLAVLSYQELSPEMNIQPLARVSLH